MSIRARCTTTRRPNLSRSAGWCTALATPGLAAVPRAHLRIHARPRCRHGDAALLSRAPETHSSTVIRHLLWDQRNTQSRARDAPGNTGASFEVPVERCLVRGWIKYARLIEQAGADALELNVYF